MEFLVTPDPMRKLPSPKKSINRHSPIENDVPGATVEAPLRYHPERLLSGQGDGRAAQLEDWLGALKRAGCLRLIT